MSSKSVHFADRRAAGRRLAALLQRLALCNPAVIALSHGGVEVGFEIARALDGELDLVTVPTGETPSHRGPIPSLDLLGRVAVIADDGAAPADALLAAVAALHREGVSSVVLAVPALCDDAIAVLERAYEDIVYLVRLANNERIEDQYGDFHDIGRSEAIHFLRDSRDPHSPPAPPLDDGSARQPRRPILTLRAPSPTNPG
jgi:predicted phosphoribosyltransferase